MCLSAFRHRLRRDAKTANASQLPALVERRHALRRRLIKFRDLQAVYMSAALPILAEDPTARLDVEHVENVRIGLPSDIADAHRARVCSIRLTALEDRLREAQCYDALQDLRNKLHTLAHLYNYKKMHVRHQGPNTKARASISQQEDRRDRAAETYRRARRAKLALAGPGDWQKSLRPLHDDDIRHLADEDPRVLSKKRKRNKKDKYNVPGGVGEGHRTVSWIWRSADSAEGSQGEDSLRVEWIKSCARQMRWEEETKLLPEEMHRCLAMLQYEEQQWYHRATAREVEDPALREGLAAYAFDQARIRKAMRRTFRAICMPAVRRIVPQLGSEWDPVEGIEDRPEDLPEVSEEYRDIAQMYELDGEDLERPQWA